MNDTTCLIDTYTATEYMVFARGSGQFKDETIIWYDLRRGPNGLEQEAEEWINVRAAACEYCEWSYEATGRNRKEYVYNFAWGDEIRFSGKIVSCYKVYGQNAVGVVTAGNPWRRKKCLSKLEGK